MTDPQNGDAWLAPVEFRNEGATDLMVYCCDGRFGSAIESFARNRLGLDRCVRLVVPGGPVCLAGDAPPFYDHERGAAAQFFFLLDALSIQRVHLVMHDRCAFYMQKIGVPEPKLRDRQITDLAKVRDRIAESRPHVIVDSWIAEVRNEDTVAFLAAPAEPSAIHS